MASSEKVIVRGLEEVEASFARYERGLQKTLSAAAYQAAKIVSADARGRFTYDRKTAMGFVPQVRGPQAKVRQRLRKTTGLRGDYGALQMRKALLPAMHSKEHEALELYKTQLEILKVGSGL